MPRTDPDLVARVLELVRLGCSATEVHETLGVPRSTVSRWARAAEAAAASEKPGEIAAAVAVLGDTWTLSGVAELAGVPVDAVRTWLRARIDRTLARRGFPPDAVPTYYARALR